MAARWKSYVPMTQLKATEIQDLADNGVVQADTPADLDSPDLINVNVVYVLSEFKIYMRSAAGVGAANWKAM